MQKVTGPSLGWSPVSVRSLSLLSALATLAACGPQMAGVNGRGSTPTTASPRSSQLSADMGLIGVNAEAPSFFGRDEMFADLFKQSGVWGDSSNMSIPASLDSNGWPTQDACVMLDKGQKDIGSPDPYHLAFTGHATLDKGVSDGTVRFQGQVYDAASNRTTASVYVSAQTTTLVLCFINTGGGIKNASLMRPNHTADEIFNHAFLNEIQPFSVIRFMDYLWANSNPLINWSDRTLTTVATQDRSIPVVAADGVTPTYANGQVAMEPAGAAYEYAIALGNQAGKDIWLNVPDRANDDFIRNLALLLKNTLNPDRVVYIEWSNEVWNPQFTQSQRNYEMAQCEVAPDWASGAAYQQMQNANDASGMYVVSHGNCYKALTTGTSGATAPAGMGTDVSDGAVHWAFVEPVKAQDRNVLNYDGDTNAYELAWRRIGKRVMEVSDIFRSVFGDNDMMTRVLPILPVQLGRTIGTELEFMEHYGSQPPSHYVYAATGADYFRPQAVINGVLQNTEDTDTVDQMIADIPNNIADNHKAILRDLKYSTYYSIGYFAYEGGQHITGAANLSNKIAVQHDPRMGDMIKQAMDDWFGAGGGLFMYYKLTCEYGANGSWGLVETLGERSVKRLALETLMSLPPPPVSSGFPVPATIAASDVSADQLQSGYAGPAGARAVVSTSGQARVDFLVRAPTAGNYHLSANVQTNGGSATISALVNAQEVESYVTNTQGNFMDIPAVPVHLRPGLNVIRFRSVDSAGYFLKSIAVTPAP